jgi:hypothetical protein
VIEPDSGEDPGFGVVVATLIPAATSDAAANDLTSRTEFQTRIAEVTVFGKTIGGLDFESAPFTYVIGICEGCLVDFPAEALDQDGLCNVPTTETIEAPCRFGQDDDVDCRLCAGGSPFCQSAREVP